MVKSKRRKAENEERKSRNKPCRSEGAERKKTKNSQELDLDHQEGEDENGEIVQAETDSAAPLEEKIDYDEETAIAVQIIMEVMAQEEKGESQLLFNDNT